MSRFCDLPGKFAVGVRGCAHRWKYFLGGLGLLIVLVPLRAERLVVIRASADPAYAQRRAASSGEPIPESYVIAKGQRTVGVSTGLSKIPFKSIAAKLATDLLEQNYVPATNAINADLVIAVHWGMTDDSQSGAAQLQYDPDALRQATEAVAEAREREAADLSGVQRTLGAVAEAQAKLKTEASVAQSLYHGNEVASASNAELLGFGPALQSEDTVGETLRSMVNEERYFVILIAYDAAELRRGKKVPRWTTRMSIRAAGVNFPTALDRMSGVAAHFNGTRQPSVVLIEGASRKGDPRLLDDVIVIGDNPEPAKNAKATKDPKGAKK